MKPGDYIVMIDFPTEKYAREYCNDVGLHIGRICLFVEQVTSNTVVIQADSLTSIGTGFLEEYFKKSSRMDNLNKLV